VKLLRAPFLRLFSGARAGNHKPQSPLFIEKNKTSGEVVAPKMWMDAYLAAFAEAAGLRLVTFHRELASKVAGSVLLG